MWLKAFETKHITNNGGVIVFSDVFNQQVNRDVYSGRNNSTELLKLFYIPPQLSQSDFYSWP